MNRPTALQLFALALVAATLALIAVGGLVTSHGVGMAVPDWPTSAGYNMFFFPFSRWIGGIFYEHTHRLTATVVGVMVVAMTRWLGGRPSRLPLAIIGLAEAACGFALLELGPNWAGAGYFLSGIGGVVLLAAVVWFRNAPAMRPLPTLGWIAFGTVQLQGLLGGLRVVLYNDQIGIFHAALAQLFFVLVCAIAFMCSRWWLRIKASAWPASPDTHTILRRWFALTTSLVFCQLVLGAAMRHQHAGLAIPDFPLAYGKAWPAVDPASIESYNRHRIEVTDANPITAFQVELQMAHRLVALALICAIAFCAWKTRRTLGPRHVLSWVTLAWVGLVLVQALLGAATVWSDKAADIATAHVLTGALILSSGALMSVAASRAGTVRSQNIDKHPDFAAFSAPGNLTV